jgi:thioredoxin 1
MNSISTSPLHLTDDSLDATIATSQDRPVVIDFWAPWCGPCKAQGPILDQLSIHEGEQVVIAKLNTDEFPEAAAKHGIRALPTILIFRDGIERTRLVGLQSNTSLSAAITAAR